MKKERGIMKYESPELRTIVCAINVIQGGPVGKPCGPVIESISFNEPISGYEDWEW